jgi:hypothetical protein
VSYICPRCALESVSAGEHNLTVADRCAFCRERLRLMLDRDGVGLRRLSEPTVEFPAGVPA